MLRRVQAVLAALVVALVVAGAACSAPGGKSATTATGAQKVVAAFYPVAEAVGRVGGSHVAVQNLTPSGTEPHDLELTTRQRDAIDDAALVVVMGDGFQPAVEAAARERGKPTLVILDHLRTRRPLVKAADPHVWLDPTLMAEMVDVIKGSLSRVDPAHRGAYERDATRYEAALRALDAEYRRGLAHCVRHEIVTTHEAFAYLAARYGLRQEALAGISPEQEPDAKRLGELADLVRRLHVTVIFTEELVSPRVADALAREAGGVRTDTLNPMESLSKREVDAGADYLSVMRSNLSKLERALGCS